jgi:hypothetical protein
MAGYPQGCSAFEISSLQYDNSLPGKRDESAKKDKEVEAKATWRLQNIQEEEISGVVSSLRLVRTLYARVTPSNVV